MVLPFLYWFSPRRSRPCDTPARMEELSGLGDQVIARLMARHGLSAQEAGLAWEQYQLRLRALRLRLEQEAETFEGN